MSKTGLMEILLYDLNNYNRNKEEQQKTREKHEPAVSDIVI